MSVESFGRELTIMAVCRTNTSWGVLSTFSSICTVAVAPYLLRMNVFEGFQIGAKNAWRYFQQEELLHLTINFFTNQTDR